MKIERYHFLSMSLHWLMAVLILTNVFIGQEAEEIKTALDISLFQLHKSLGITVLLLTLARIGLRFAIKAPAPPASMKTWEIKVLKAVHGLFYLLMIGLPLTGWLLVSLSPYKIPTVLFGVFPWPHLPVEGIAADSKELMEAIGGVHGIMSKTMMVLFILHVGAALKHHFNVRDEVLFRMVPAGFEGFLKKVRGEKP